MDLMNLEQSWYELQFFWIIILDNLRISGATLDVTTSLGSGAAHLLRSLRSPTAVREAVSGGVRAMWSSGNGTTFLDSIDGSKGTTHQENPMINGKIMGKISGWMGTFYMNEWLLMMVDSNWLVGWLGFCSRILLDLNGSGWILMDLMLLNYG